jgi:hypothetical protein
MQGGNEEVGFVSTFFGVYDYLLSRRYDPGSKGTNK